MCGVDDSVKDWIELYLLKPDASESLYRMRICGPDKGGDLRVCIPETTTGRGVLLLGENDDHKIRLLMVPENDRLPEIQDLPLTFSQARAILEQKWEEEVKADSLAGRSRSFTPALLTATVPDCALLKLKAKTSDSSSSSTKQGREHLSRLFENLEGMLKIVV